MTTLTQITVREIANELSRTIYQVRYAIESRCIEPVHRAGLVRLFDPSAIEEVREALVEIDRRRRTVPAA